MLGQNLAKATPGSAPQGREAPALRRGACPGLSTPMPTGDGLLVRLLLTGTIALDAFATLCDAAQTYGNGVIEITSRGSIQVRGLTPDSAPRFAAAVGAAAIAAADGIPVLSNVLAGLDPGEILDAGALARDLRATLAQTSLGASISPKVSVIIDGGGSLNLDDLAADVRLRAKMSDGHAAFRISIGGDGASSVEIGSVAPARGVEAAMALLDVIAQRGRDARAREVLATEGPAPFRAALADAGGWCEVAPSAKESKPSEAIGAHRLHDGSLAYGIGLAFGHADAMSLRRLVEAARSAGGSGLRAAPGRVVMVIGLAQADAPAFAASAEQLGFITHADDPRRYVIACAGAPICAAAHIAARAVAPAIAAAAAPFLDRSFTIHVSGCAKGCAHPRPAALTVVGTPEGCALVADGSPRDVSYTLVQAHELPAAIARAAYERTAASRDV
jgi:precorrin-3B synthase